MWGEPSFWAKKIGIGVKNMFDAKEKNNMAMPNARKLSFLSLSVGEYPSRICEATFDAAGGIVYLSFYTYQSSFKDQQRVGD